MYSRNRVGPRMEPWRTSALTGYLCEDFPCRTTWSCLLLRKDEIRWRIWSDEIRWNKVTYLTKVCEKDQYAKPCLKPWINQVLHYSLSNPRPIRIPSNSIRYNCQKICSWLRRPRTILESQKKGHISSGDH